MSQDKKSFRFVLRSVGWWGFIVSLLALIFVSFAASDLSAIGEQSGGTPGTEIDRGVVVEKVLPHSEAEKAGLQEGDTLLAWSRGDSKGEIQSPFDLFWIGTEQRPLGIVKLEGLRGTGRQVWSLGPDTWGLTARPNFSGKLLSSYREGQDRVQMGKATEASKLWKELANRHSASQATWFPAWLYVHAAEAL